MSVKDWLSGHLDALRDVPVDYDEMSISSCARCGGATCYTIGENHVECQHCGLIMIGEEGDEK